MTLTCHACEQALEIDDPGINAEPVPCPSCGAPVRITATARAVAAQQSRKVLPAPTTLTLSPASTWIIARGVFYGLLAWTVFVFLVSLLIPFRLFFR